MNTVSSDNFSDTECANTKTTCDLLGITSLDSHALFLTEKISRDYLKGTILQTKSWANRCGRSVISISDVENVIANFQGSSRISSMGMLSYGIDQLVHIPSSNIFSHLHPDLEVDKEDTETHELIPRDFRLISYPLVNDGQPVTSEFTAINDEDGDIFYDKSNSDSLIKKKPKIDGNCNRASMNRFRSAAKFAKEEQTVGLKPIAVETLTLEQQIFMKEIITICMGQDDKKRHEALYTLETDAGLQIFLPHLTERICKSISANISQRCLSLIIYAGRVIRSISHNKACDMTVTLHNVIPALLSCCVGRNICLRPEIDNHWALRDFSSKTLVGLIKDQVDARDGGNTSKRLFNFAYRVFKDSSSTFSMIYGTIHILQELVEPEKTAWLLNELSDVLMRCRQYGEANKHSVALSVQEANKLIQHILKYENLIRNRMKLHIRI